MYVTLVFVLVYNVITLFTQKSNLKNNSHTRLAQQSNFWTKIQSPLQFLINKLSKKSRLICEYIR
jgi:hypothetical protein